MVKYTNATGAVLKSYDYDAFGEEADPSTTDANPFRYVGQYFDDETGTYYLRARYYNPDNGRFSQEDPIRSGLNWYAYCGNNPVMYVDPFGLEKIVVSGGLYQAGDGYEYEFIDSALKEIIDYNGNEKVTLAIANIGYSDSDFERINEYAEAYGFSVFIFSDVMELIGYLNNGLDNNRADDLITKFTVFAHGYVGSIEFGHGFVLDKETRQKLSFTTDKLGLLDSNAFNNTYSIFYSCNTGTPIDGKASFAQIWSNVTGGRTKAAIGKTDYTRINAISILSFDSWLVHKSLRKLVGGYAVPYSAFRKPGLAKDAKWNTFRPN